MENIAMRQVTGRAPSRESEARGWVVVGVTGPQHRAEHPVTEG